jgi:ABC-2 type transport system permease protein
MKSIRWRRARANLRAYPTLLRVAFNEAVAYRAELFVWMLTMTMPLVNLALWHTVAAGGPIGRFAQPDLVAYFLSGLVVRQLTGSWVVWEMNREIRSGLLSFRLLRPIHTLVAYSAENLAATPLRAALSLPVAVGAWIVAGGGHFLRDPLLWIAVPISIAAAWVITFAISTIIGALGFFLESSLSLFDVYLASFFAFSGYLFPIEFLAPRAPWAMRALHALPFYFQFGFPVELLLGHHGRAAALAGIGMQCGWALALSVAMLFIWRAGLKRWNAPTCSRFSCARRSPPVCSTAGISSSTG